MQTQKKGLVDKSDITGFINHSDLNKKVATLAKKSRIKSRAGKNKKVRSISFRLFPR